MYVYVCILMKKNDEYEYKDFEVKKMKRIIVYIYLLI